MIPMAGILTALLTLMAAFGAACANDLPSASPAEPAPATAIAPSERSTPPPPLESLLLERTFGSLAFRAPTNMVQAGTGQVLIGAQAGGIWIFEEKQLTAEEVSAPDVLDIRDHVSSRGSEEGLLGMALNPVNEEELYLYYSSANPRRSVVSRFIVDFGRNAIDPDSELIVLEVEQPYPNHNGGQIAFGPDGYLYVGLGDGGSAGDPLDSGQDTSTLLGSILRIDVSNSTAAQPYSIPPDNPFVDGGGRPEIWAYGLRNPWRFSFDRRTGELWAGDVGQNEWEEIDVIERGGNYGWNTLEGNHCFQPRDGCDREGTIAPVWEYSLDGAPCSVIGGYVYRGDDIPWLRGAYVYGDFCSGKVFGLRYQDGGVIEHKELADTGMRIMSFAEDNAGELYLLSQREGIHRLVEGR